MFKKIRRLIDQIYLIEKQNEELIWAQTWHDTILGIDWAKNLSGISPGRWAVGYNYIYVMTRILNETKPSKILDLGLGLSSTLIGTYLNYKKDDDRSHTIIEHDKNWADFYWGGRANLEYSTIIIKGLATKTYNGVEYYAYSDIADVVSGNRYDVISVDAPFEGTKYSRRDIIDYIPDILNDSFVVIIDDVNRQGEKNTVSDIEDKLRHGGIRYKIGYYTGMTDCCVIVSDDFSYLCTL